MSYDYNETLRRQIYRLKETNALDGYDFVIDSEQAFLKYKDLKPNTIYVLTKMLQNEIQIGVDTQPIQILILSEQNQLEVAKGFFAEFAKEYNFKAELSGSTWTKQQYSEPVVLSAFNTVDYGYRAVMYMSATIFIMENVVDVRNLQIDGNKIDALTFAISYGMTPNTQQLSENEFIGKSVKSASSLSISMTLPVQDGALIRKIIAIMNETDTSDAVTPRDNPQGYGGNEDFAFSFDLGSIPFSVTMKLTIVDFGSAINDIPTIRLGFMK